MASSLSAFINLRQLCPVLITFCRLCSQFYSANILSLNKHWCEYANKTLSKLKALRRYKWSLLSWSLVLIWIPLWQGELCRRVSTKFTLHVLVAGEGEQDVKVIHSWGRHSHTQAKQTSSCVYYSLNLKRTSLNNTCNLKSQNSPQEDSETKVLWHDTKRYTIRQTPPAFT